MTQLVIGPETTLLERLLEKSPEFSGGQLRIAVAWARLEGAVWISSTFPDLEKSVIVGLNNSGTSIEALLHLLEKCETLHAFFKHPDQTFHPKLYCLNDIGSPPTRAALFAGSSNLTRGGLLTNLEASMLAELAPATDPSDLQVYSDFVAAWERLLTSPFCHAITQVSDVERLYQAGYTRSESALRWQRRRARRQERPRGDLPTSPPPSAGRAPHVQVDIPFALDLDDGAGEAPQEHEDPNGIPPLAERFFVRTLTGNDVEKMQGRQVGTFEPDLGETARDIYPSFWGWPSEYATVQRTLPRFEWEASARLFSRSAPPAGVEVTAMLWYREERPGHAPEHRLRLGPIGTVRDVVPVEFDENSLLVVERAPQAESYEFVIRLVLQSDPEYTDYASYLNVHRPRHSFGYGP